MTEPSRDVVELAERRAQARAERDFVSADNLRDEIAAAGWIVHDTPGGGFELTAKPPFEVWPTVESIPVTAVVVDISRLDQGGSKAGQALTGSEDRARQWEQARDQAVAAERAGDRPERSHEGAGPALKPQHAEAARVANEASGVVDDPTAPGGMIETALTRAGTPSMVASQLLWDGSSATSRIDQVIADHEKSVHRAAEEALDRDRREQAGEPSSGAPAEQNERPLVSVGILVDGWPDDLRTCVESLIAHTSAQIVALDLGDVDGAGAMLHELAQRYPDRVKAWHVAEKPHWREGSAGWGAARSKLLHLDNAQVHVVLETSTVFEGDAITPLVHALDADGVAAAGWRGVIPANNGHQWAEAGPGEVKALLGHLFAVRRLTALGVGGFPERARFSRHADLEFSLNLPGKLVVPEKDLPVREERHRGYHDVDPEYRDKESRRTYDRVLKRLRETGDD
ncbi:hypothetical protein Acor_62390 [Acrocarpospora corrugata]|uniref:Uncharacterized protein n=1 Tax=Acrocarpospora corrugata TaxID=35763 RepID=A0A5M3W856_9ACTN|nr:glycosyltransferase family A protein [Acrocarpospora corrugata]GES04172.1 hypothetical protein Acor_62390 [Acrocarpospora corrugata]